MITETVRGDLADDLASILDLKIASAVDYFANERFWFNESRQVLTLAANQQFFDLPTTYRTEDAVYVVIGGVRFDMTKRSMLYLENLYTVNQTGQPTDWCYFNDASGNFTLGQTSLGANNQLGPGSPSGVQAIRVWPTPAQPYQAIFLGIADVYPYLSFTTPGTTNPSTNSWLNYAYDLISARTKFTLYRDQFRDRDAAEAAKMELDEAYDNVKGESNRRMATGRLRSSW